MIKSSKSHVSYLDGLRGIACLVVILAHLQIFIIPAFSADGRYHDDIFKGTVFFWLNGNFPVCIFFVLSGYVLILNYLHHPHDQYLAKAVVKRYFRLTPLIFSSVLVSFLLLKHNQYYINQVINIVGFDSWLSPPNPRPKTIEAISQGLVSVFFRDSSLNLPLWTMKIEYWGSLFIFAFCALFFNTKRFVLIGSVGLILLALPLKYPVYYVSLFLYGAMLLKIPQNKHLAWLFWPGIFLGIQPADGTFVNGIVSYLAAYNITFAYPTVDKILHCLGACMLMTSVLNSDMLKKALSFRPIVWLGEISFGMYVFHMVVALSIGSLVYLYSRENMGAAWAAVFAAIATYALTIVMAMIAYKFIDRPSQRLANKIANWLIRPMKTE